MKEIEFFTPWPPSINNTYVNRRTVSPIPNAPTKKNKGRKLSIEARSYKKYVSDLLYFTFPFAKYGDQLLEAIILASPPDDKRKRDNHNNYKCLFDAIQFAGTVNDDSQIVKSTIIPLPPHENGYWFVKLRPYTRLEDAELIEAFFNGKGAEKAIAFKICSIPPSGASNPGQSL